MKPRSHRGLAVRWAVANVDSGRGRDAELLAREHEAVGGGFDPWMM